MDCGVNDRAKIFRKTEPKTSEYSFGDDDCIAAHVVIDLILVVQIIVLLGTFEIVVWIFRVGCDFFSIVLDSITIMFFHNDIALLCISVWHQQLYFCLFREDDIGHMV